MFSKAKERRAALCLVAAVAACLVVLGGALHAGRAYGDEAAATDGSASLDVTYSLSRGKTGSDVASATDASSSDTSTSDDVATAKARTVALVTDVSKLGTDDATVEDGGTSFSSIAFGGIDAAKVQVRYKRGSADWTDRVAGDADQANANGSVSCIQLKLDSEAAEKYSIVYRVHVADAGWLGWTADGETAGSEKDGAVVDDVEIMLVAKDNSEALTSFLGSQEAKAHVEADDSTGSDSKADTSEGEKSEGVSSAAKVNAVALTSTTSQVQASVSYRAHVQNIGWQASVSDGATAGTTGKSLRVEALSMSLSGVSGSIRYRAHVQNVGWQDWQSDGQTSGTTGRSLRVEAVQIELTGDVASDYDVYYRTHVQNRGWTSWVKNGATSGTTGQSLRIEAVQVLLVKHGQAIPTGDGADYTKRATTTYTSPTIIYQSHVQNVGWQTEVSNGTTAGTTGKSLRLEALKVAVAGVNGGVQYNAYVQGTGWQGLRSDGAVAGTEGSGLRLEAIQVQLTGDVASSYDVYYRVHVSDIGWMAWAKDGETAGTVGLGRRIEAVQIVLVKKGSAAPSSSDQKVSYPSVETPTVSYATSALNGDWQTAVSNGATSGTTGKSLSVERFRAQLSSVSGFGGIKYQVSTDGENWSSAAINGADAGTKGTALKAVRLSLTGDAEKYYDVWYRVHVSNVGWLGWTRSGSDAGTNVSSNSIEAVEVIVKLKGSDAPGSTVRPFAYVDQLNGYDISSHQAGIDVSKVSGDFVFIKATQGTWYRNQLSSKGYDYAAWADKALASGKLVGFYHYAEGGDPIKEADYFYDAIKAYKGRAVVALDWEQTSNKLFGTGFDVQWCKKFLDRIATLMDARPLIYMSKSVTRKYDWSTVATSYPLWVAQYANNKTTGYNSNPWTDSYSYGAWASPTIFQYSENGRVDGYSADLDLDLFYGTRSAWISLQ